MKFLFARFFLLLPVFAMAVLTVSSVEAAESARPLIFKDAQPKMHRLSARASQLDSRAREYPKIGFIFGTD